MASKQLQGPGTREVKFFTKSSNNAVEPRLIGEHEARDLIVNKPRPSVLKKNTRKDVDLPSQMRESIAVPPSRAPSSEQNIGPAAQQTDIPSRTVHSSATLGSTIVPSRGVEIAMVSKGQRVPVTSHDDHPSVSHGRNANATQSVETPAVHVARQHAKETSVPFINGPSHSRARVLKEAVASKGSLSFDKLCKLFSNHSDSGSRPSSGSENVLTSDNQGYSQRNSPSERREASMTISSKHLNSQPITSTDLVHAVIPSSHHTRSSSRNAEPAPYLLVSQRTNVIQDKVQHEAPKSDQPFPARLPSFQDTRLADILSSSAPAERREISFIHNNPPFDLQSPAPTILIYPRTTNPPPPHPLPSLDIPPDTNHLFDSRAGSKPTLTSRPIPSQAYLYNVDPHATAGDLETGPVKTQSHPETFPKRSSHSRSRSNSNNMSDANNHGTQSFLPPTFPKQSSRSRSNSNNMSDANNFGTQSILPPSAQTAIATASSTNSTGPPRSGGAQTHDNVKASQKVLSTPVNPISYTLQHSNQKTKRIDPSEVREIPLMLHNDLDSRSADVYPPKLIPLPQAHPSSTQHQHPSSQTHNRAPTDLPCVTSKESILKLPSSLALKPTVSRTSIPASFSSESRKRGLFSIFRSKDTRAAEQAPAVVAKEIAKVSETRTKATMSGITGPRRDDTRQEPPTTAPTVPLDRASDHKSPHSKAFTPFRYIASKRHRTVSAASLEAQDGTAVSLVVLLWGVPR